ncbi:hypothetical protein AMAG_01616 [Allomyces macrogynus ATCC 38327]|uniref:GB1/RHD3-type G domain-containing protein n=1 Tax=Allomyces macrogynus (strain ATCC 38327) TaxID=578462 RepID=A0A0L0S082_ALLM3|nr:hypothetical protein AMAG_01616 [Allomyces macrogynus ATCC 38327]|eukprot:KNE55739.1 hypothetical protein AMAG_01616 [Allomyces macrogynus ATCC 38327]
MSNPDVSVDPTPAASLQELAEDAAHAPAPAASDVPLPQSPDAAPPAAAPAAPKEETSRDLAVAAPPAEEEERTVRLQIIDDEKRFTPDLDEYMDAKWHVLDRGFDYNMIAVFGSQSTGKSTLLNRIFHTDFDVMNESRRGQTTKGIWLAKAPGLKGTLVMDVEGTDGRERGEDQDFERKSSLFALAIAEVIIINMWEHMVGLYQGANMGLLKVVLDVNLSLFQKKGSPRTHLFFVIRDHASGTPLEMLAETVRTDLDRIWASLNKPPGLENAKLDDFFDVTFTSLPHKRLQPDRFESEAEKLRGRFIDPHHPQFVFQPRYKKGIPADGFPRFARDIWDQINANRDLDLPSQQELLAQFRCDELAAVASAAYTKSTAPLRARIEGGEIVDTFGQDADAALEAALAPFDQSASRYHRGVYERKRADLIDRVVTATYPVYSTQMRNAHRRAINLFKNGLDFKLKAKHADFFQVVETTTEEVARYLATVSNLTKLKVAGWTGDEAVALLRSELAVIVDERRVEELAKLTTATEKQLVGELNEAVALILADPQPAMWTRVDETFKDLLGNAEQALTRRATMLRIDGNETAERLDDLRASAAQALKDAIAAATSDAALVQRLRAKFEEKFRYDDQGVPRVWSSADDIDGVYKKARDEAAALLASYSEPAPLPAVQGLVADRDLALVPETLATSVADLGRSLVPPARVSDVTLRFRREVDVMYTEAKRSVVAAQAHVPKWVFAVMLVLGWNELSYLLTNPVMLFLFLLIGAVAYVLHMTGLDRPALSVANRVGMEAARQVGERIHDATGGRGIAGAVNGYFLDQVRPASASKEDLELTEKKTQ